MAAAVQIHWKKGKEIKYGSEEPSTKKRKMSQDECIGLDEEEEQVGFFNFLTSTDIESYDIASDIVYDVYPNAVKYFNEEDDEFSEEEFSQDE
jgi:hypothetical protein